MLRPTLKLTIDGNEIPTSQFYDFTAFDSVDTTLPQLSFKIRDPDGQLLSKLSIKIGSEINIQIFDQEEALMKAVASKEEYDLCKFSVTKVYDGMELNLASGSGFIQIWCIQSWALYGDYRGKAYKPALISSIIEDVCKNIHKSAGLDEDVEIEESTDAGKNPRYKCNESDIDFIEKKLLPYCSVGKSNAFFYVDLLGKIHLTSFNTMFAKKETALFSPIPEQVGVIDDPYEKQDELGLDGSLMYNSCKVSLGNEQIEKFWTHILKKCYLVDHSMGATLFGKIYPRVSIGKSGSNIYNVLPIESLKLASTEATGAFNYQFGILDDQLNRAINDDLYLNDMFSVTLTTVNEDPRVVVGSTAYLQFPKVYTENKLGQVKYLSHWLEGKWLVYSKIVAKDKKEAVSAMYTLIKPMITLSQTKNAVDMPFTLYGGINHN